MQSSVDFSVFVPYHLLANKNFQTTIVAVSVASESTYCAFSVDLMRTEKKIY